MTYRIRIECGNCFSRNNYEIDRGRTHDDFDLICPNCGCSPNSAKYSIIVDNAMSNYTKKEDEVIKEESS